MGTLSWEAGVVSSSDPWSVTKLILKHSYG